MHLRLVVGDEAAATPRFWSLALDRTSTVLSVIGRHSIVPPSLTYAEYIEATEAFPEVHRQTDRILATRDRPIRDARVRP